MREQGSKDPKFEDTKISELEFHYTIHPQIIAQPSPNMPDPFLPSFGSHLECPSLLFYLLIHRLTLFPLLDRNFLYLYALELRAEC